VHGKAVARVARCFRSELVGKGVAHTARSLIILVLRLGSLHVFEIALRAIQLVAVVDVRPNRKTKWALDTFAVSVAVYN